MLPSHALRKARELTKILIVEDDAEKLRRVLSRLLQVPGLNRDMIDDARDANSAKRMMRTTSYDLLVLDISIPSHANEMPSHGAGLELLHEVLERDVYHTPAQIVGLTAHQEALDAARPRFEMDVLQIVQYDPASLDWAEKLGRIARRVALAAGQPAADRSYGSDLCVVTALAKPELDAVLALPWQWEVHELSDDPTVYHKGRFNRADGSGEVIAAAAPRMGMQASAVLAAKMAITFRPRYLVMTGVLAGVQGECELGDIIAADPSWDYGSGKRTIRDGSPAFAAAPHQATLDPFLRGKLGRMAQDGPTLDRIRREWRGTPPQTILSMRLGPVASGAAVLEDPTVVDQIRAQHRKTLGVEMETYGVFVAAEESPMPQPRCFSLKSVCDFADPFKNNDHQAYAAYTSAAALRKRRRISESTRRHLWGIPKTGVAL